MQLQFNVLQYYLVALQSFFLSIHDHKLQTRRVNQSYLIFRVVSSLLFSFLQQPTLASVSTNILMSPFLDVCLQLLASYS